MILHSLAERAFHAQLSSVSYKRNYANLRLCIFHLNSPLMRMIAANPLLCSRGGGVPLGSWSTWCPRAIWKPSEASKGLFNSAFSFRQKTGNSIWRHPDTFRKFLEHKVPGTPGVCVWGGVAAAFAVRHCTHRGHQLVDLAPRQQMSQVCNWRMSWYSPTGTSFGWLFWNKNASVHCVEEYSNGHVKMNGKNYHMATI